MSTFQGDLVGLYEGGCDEILPVEDVQVRVMAENEI